MSTLCVSKVATTNFKNLRLEDGLDLGNLTVFIGSNGSGKSNLVSLLRFLQHSIAGSILSDQRGQTTFEDAVFDLGGARILDGFQESPARVGIEYTFPLSERDTVLNIELLVQSAHHPVIIARETLARDQGQPEPFVYYNAHNQRSGGSGNGIVSLYNDPQTSNQPPKSHFEKIQEVPTNELALDVMPRLLENSNFSPEATPLYGPRAAIRAIAATSMFYSANEMNPERIRAAEPKLGQSGLFLSPTGENLALVLYNLFQKDLEFEESLNLVMKDILPLTRRVRAVTSGMLSLTIEWYVDGCSKPFFLSEMSDGTVRMLTWAVILHSPTIPRLIVIDEPELGIHPAWMPLLAEWIKGASQRTQIIVSTHSPDLLDHFTDQLDSGGLIYAFGPVDESPNHYTPRRLSVGAVSGWLKEGWQLGDLYRVGNPAVGGWPW